MSKLDGKVALISGGARGMGAADAEILIQNGAKVMIADVLDDDGAATAARLGDACRYVHLDVTRDDDWKAAVAATVDAFGSLDILVNNAGIVLQAPLESMDSDDFRRVIDVNLNGVYLGMKYAIPELKKSGDACIVNISSTAGLMGYQNTGAYVASKWAVRGMTKTAAMELGQYGIRVNSIHPGLVWTPMTEGMSDAIFASQALPRAGTTDELAKLLLFIVADATYSTGSEFVAGGGQTLGAVVRD